MGEDKDFKSSWNMAEALIFEASNQKAAANRAIVNRDYDLAVRHLINLKGAIIGILNPDERGQLKKVEKDFIIQEAAYRNLMVKRNNTFASKDLLGNLSLEYYKIHDIYDNYNTLIMDFMQKRDLLLNAKKDTTKLNL